MRLMPSTCHTRFYQVLQLKELYKCKNTSTLEESKIHNRKLTNLWSFSLSSCLNYIMSSAQHSNAAGLPGFAQHRAELISSKEQEIGYTAGPETVRGTPSGSIKMPMPCGQSSFCTCKISISNYEMNYYERDFAFVLSKRIAFLKKFKGCVPLWCLTKKNTSPCWGKGFANYCYIILHWKLHS